MEMGSLSTRLLDEGAKVVLLATRSCRLSSYLVVMGKG